MSEFHPRVLAAQRGQLEARREALDAGAAHVGWKVALAIPCARELIGDRPLFGYLTSASRLHPGTAFVADGLRKLQVDCELAVELGRGIEADEGPESIEAAIAGVATGLELCDVGRPPYDLEGIVAANVFHRAFIAGPFRRVADGLSLSGRVRVNGELRGEGTAGDVLDRIGGVVRLLDAVGERARAGDRIICGAICSGMLERGDQVEVEVGDLGPVEVEIAR